MFFVYNLWLELGMQTKAVVCFLNWIQAICQSNESAFSKIGHSARFDLWKKKRKRLKKKEKSKIKEQRDAGKRQRLFCSLSFCHLCCLVQNDGSTKANNNLFRQMNADSDDDNGNDDDDIAIVTTKKKIRLIEWKSAWLCIILCWINANASTCKVNKVIKLKWQKQNKSKLLES